MALVLADNVKETTSTTGNTNWNLAGAVTGYQSFSVLGNGNTTYYSARDDNAVPPTWEVGLGTVVTGSPNVLQRTTVLASSNAGAKIVFANTPTVWCDLPASAIVLASVAALTSLSSVGTITSGTWNAGSVTSSSEVKQKLVGSTAIVTAFGGGYVANNFSFGGGKTMTISMSSYAIYVMTSDSSAHGAYAFAYYQDAAVSVGTDSSGYWGATASPAGPPYGGFYKSANSTTLSIVTKSGYGPNFSVNVLQGNPISITDPV